ncbi:MAG: hypothetical protein GPW19_00095 [Euryarchaeota archaeon]|nr:hypothetical protein [Euryarchaeota archaeon]
MENRKNMEKDIKKILKNLEKQTVIIRTAKEDLVCEVKAVNNHTVSIKHYRSDKNVEEKVLPIKKIESVTHLSGIQKIK